MDSKPFYPYPPLLPVLRIGVTIWSLGPTTSWDTFEKQLSTAREIGVEGVQLWCVDYGPSTPCLLDPDRCGTECRRRVQELLSSYGLEITGFCAQLSGPRTFGGLDDPEGLEERIEKTKKALSLAAELGAPIVTTHPGFIPEDKEDHRYGVIRRSIAEIARHGEDVGAYFCIETGMEHPAVLRAFLEDVSSPAVKVNYDPANLLRYGVDEVVRGVETLGPWIAHTHAKDYNPSTRRATVGEGLVPWERYLQALKMQGYQGWLALEDETGLDVVNSLKRGRMFLERLVLRL